MFSPPRTIRRPIAVLMASLGFASGVLSGGTQEALFVGSPGSQQAQWLEEARFSLTYSDTISPDLTPWDLVAVKSYSAC